MSKSVPISNRRRSRVNFTSHQLESMEAVFDMNQYPDYRSREALADSIGLTEARIQVEILNIAKLIMSNNFEFISPLQPIFSNVISNSMYFFLFHRFGFRIVVLAKNVR